MVSWDIMCLGEILYCPSSHTAPLVEAQPLLVILRGSTASAVKLFQALPQSCLSMIPFAGDNLGERWTVKWKQEEILVCAPNHV